MGKVSKDTILGLCLAGVFTVILFFIIPRAVVVPSSIKIMSLRPDFWPGFLLVLLIVFSLLLAGIPILKSIRSKDQTDTKKTKISACTQPSQLEQFKPYVVMIGLFVYYIMVEPLGIVVSSIIALGCLALLYGVCNMKTLVPVSVILPIGLYLFFTKIANIPLPVGLIF